MSRYIDADKVKEYILSTGFYCDTEADRKYSAELIDELFPAADVQEVKNGEWVFKFYCGNMSGYDYGMTCSVCGKPTHRQFAEKMPPFCPNCGAKMDEVTG